MMMMKPFRPSVFCCIIFLIVACVQPSADGFTTTLFLQSGTSTMLWASTTPTTESLFDRIGGAAAVQATVDAMYIRILDDPTLAPFFKDTDMKTQKKHQTVFLTMAFGGMKANIDIPTYIKEKHAKSFEHGLNVTHFDSVAGHVLDSLKSLHVREDLIDEVAGVVAPLRPLFESSS